MWLEGVSLFPKKCCVDAKNMSWFARLFACALSSGTQNKIRPKRIGYGPHFPTKEMLFGLSFADSVKLVRVTHPKVHIHRVDMEYENQDFALASSSSYKIMLFMFNGSVKDVEYGWN